MADVDDDAPLPRYAWLTSAPAKQRTSDAAAAAPPSAPRAPPASVIDLTGGDVEDTTPAARAPVSRTAGAAQLVRPRKFLFAELRLFPHAPLCSLTRAARAQADESESEEPERAEQQLLSTTEAKARAAQRSALPARLSRTSAPHFQNRNR
jgi:hypothetical protein